MNANDMLDRFPVRLRTQFEPAPGCRTVIETSTEPVHSDEQDVVLRDLQQRHTEALKILTEWRDL